MNKKLYELLNAWQEKEDFGKGLDIKILNKANLLLEKQNNFVKVSAPLYKLAFLTACFIAAVITYRNTIFDNSIQNLYNLINLEMNNNIEIKDFKIYLTNKIVQELIKDKIEVKSLSNLELIANIPENISLEEQKRDIRTLLKETLQNKRDNRFAVLNAIDDGMRFIEENLKISLSIANVNSSVSDLFKQACFDFDNKNYDKAEHRFTLLVENSRSPAELSSSLFKLGFINELAKKHNNAIDYYKMIKKKFPASVEAKLSDEMIKLASFRKVLSERIEVFKNNISASKETPKTYYELGNMYLELLDFDSAILSYSRTIEKSYGSAVKKAKFNCGWCYKIKKDYKNALQMFSSVSNSNRSLKQITDFQMALIYMKQGEFNKANELTGKGDEYPVIYKSLLDKYFKAITDKNQLKEVY